MLNGKQAYAIANLLAALNGMIEDGVTISVEALQLRDANDDTAKDTHTARVIASVQRHGGQWMLQTLPGEFDK